jgi:HEAT repeat protein
MASLKQRSTGVPLPSLWKWLVVGAALCGGWLLWTDLRRGERDDDEDQPAANPVANLRAVEATALRGREAVPLFVAALSAPDARSREYAIYGLSRIGRDAAAALGAVRERLADDAAAVRTSAIVALARISTDPEEIAVDLARMLGDPDGRVQEEAVKVLIGISEHGVQPLLKVLHSDLAESRRRTIAILRNPVWYRRAEDRQEIGAAVRPLLEDDDPVVRADALAALVEWNLASPAEVGQLLRDDEPIRVNVALATVARQGESASALLPDVLALIDRWQVDTTDARGGQSAPRGLENVLWTLKSMKTAARPAAPRLLQLFHSRHDWTRISIARTLAAIGVAADELVPILVPMLLDPDWRMANEAGELLVKISPAEARRQVSLLVPRLGSGDSVDITVLRALLSLGPQADEAVRALIPLLSHKNREVSDFAAYTLKAIGVNAADSVPALILQLGNASASLENRIHMAEALVAIGPAAGSAVPVLRDIIDRPEPATANLPLQQQSELRLRTVAMAAAASIGDGDPQLIRALRGRLSSRWSDIRIAALKALSRLDGDSTEVLADLVHCLADPANQARAHAALEIGGLSCDRREAVASLIGALDDENPYVRTAAAVSLGKIGADARSALTALRDAVAASDNVMLNRQSDPFFGQHVGWQFGIPELGSTSVKAAAQEAIAAIEKEMPAEP